MSELDSVPTPEEPRPPTERPVPDGDVAGSHAAPVVPPVPPRRSRAGMFFLGTLSGCLVVFAVVFLIAVAVAMSDNGSGELSLAGEKVAIIPIEGEIFDSRDTIDALHRYANNDSVKAMVIRINSPGGAISPSQEIYAAIRSIRAKSGKPIVASFDSVAASGGYYIAVACDEIVSNPGSITGSIGVVLQWFEMKDLMQWAKLKPETITSGPLKAAGSPYKELSEAERQYFQNIVKQLHGQFVRAVAEGRKGKITPADAARLADGRVFTGEEALALKLVDKLGTIDDAVDVAGRLAGIKGEPAKIWPRRREDSLLELLTDSGDAEAAIERILSRRVPRFMYRW